MDQLIVALDVDSGARALELASELQGVAGGFKVGSRLFTLEGPRLVRQLVDRGHRVFLDLKFHDIPNTVGQAVAAGVDTGAWMINVHASGGLDMMRAAVDAGRRAANAAGKSPPILIGVTVLTSMSEQGLQAVGVSRSLENQVLALARNSLEAGLDGVVASPHETAPIRATLGKSPVIVTPGIRGAAAGVERHDQHRTMGPAEAIAAGANYIVVGRPIIAAPDPRLAAEAIAADTGH